MLTKTKLTDTRRASIAIDQGDLMDHLDLFEPILKARGLTAYLDCYMQSLIGALAEPAVYHGLTHTKQVVLNAFEGAVLSGFTHPEIKVILVAALFHDFQHSHGRDNDATNIRRAVGNFSLIHDTVPKRSRLDESGYRDVVRLIGQTKYPYPVSRKELCVAGRILRDADRMVNYTGDDELYLSLVCGMFNEFLPYTEEGTIAELLTKQTAFTTTLRWESQWGYLKYQKKNWPAIAKARTQLIKNRLSVGVVERQLRCLISEN